MVDDAGLVGAGSGLVPEEANLGYIAAKRKTVLKKEMAEPKKVHGKDHIACL
jgi:hypothetical protein